MKIREILSEGPVRKKLRKSADNAIPGLKSYDHLDNNNHPYLAYRFGVALAGSPDTDMAQQGPIGGTFNTIDYTEADADIRRGAEKLIGVSPNRSTNKSSTELEIINKSSPVATAKRNKYGV
jgi:hypothetical protein